jgi:hypothetical protein
MTNFIRIAFSLLAITSLASAASARQDTQPEADPFSILAPRPAEPVEVEEAAETTPPPAGAHMSRYAYLERRAGHHDQILRTRWRVTRTDLDGTELSTQTRTLVLGDDYAYEAGTDSPTIHDFGLNRILSQATTLDGPVMLNRAIVADVHRKMDVFTSYTRGGQLDQIPGPNGTSFERFWIEAAMGVRLTPAVLQIQADADGQTQVSRFASGETILTLTPDLEGTQPGLGTFVRWLRHSVPIHPDALDAISALAGLPQQFSFLVYSPSSPNGRLETWTRVGDAADLAAFPWPENIPAARATSYTVADPSFLPLIQAGLDAAAAPEQAPDQQSFLDTAQTAQDRADRTGAYLTLFQATHHFGSCSARTTSPVCHRLGQAAAAGLGDTQFENLFAAMSAMTDDQVTAITGLQPNFHRNDFAGAAANLLAAQALATLRTSQADAMPSLNPAALFSAAGEADGYAPLTYWHAGRYAANSGDIETAWMFFDLARSLPDSAHIPALSEADAMTEQLHNIAPRFFGSTADE